MQFILLLFCFEGLETVTKGIEEIKATQNVIVDLLMDINSRITKLEQSNPVYASEPSIDVTRLELPKTNPGDLEALDKALETDPQFKRDLVRIKKCVTMN